MGQEGFRMCEDDCRTALLRKLVAEMTTSGEDMRALLRGKAAVVYWLNEQRRHEEARQVEAIDNFVLSGRLDGLVRIHVLSMQHEVTLIDFKPDA